MRGHASFHAMSTKAALLGSIAGMAMMATATASLAGGFEVREQSTHFQGMSFAGAAAGGKSLSSMFWNPAASNYVGAGLTFESNYALILPKSETTILTGPYGAGGAQAACPAAADCSEDIGRVAVVPASYMAARISSTTVFAMSINSQFGLATQPDNRNWAGAIYNTGAKLFSVNVAPSISHEIMPGLAIGAGLQIQYLDLQRFQTTTPGRFVNPRAPAGSVLRSQLQGDSVDIGWTLGVNWKPTSGTSIGLGWRSAITHQLDGEFQTAGLLASSTPIEANIDTPDKVTLSIMQDISPVMRLAATVEWMQWSRVGNIPVSRLDSGAPLLSSGGRPITIDLGWEDAWFFALGGEYDVNDKLTVRLGGAYELSPVGEPEQRLYSLPDNDRIWASIGASYKWSDKMTVDFAYSHVFVKDADMHRTTADGSPAAISTATAESSVDILSIGLKSKF